ncbi:MAG TPA: Sec-independent protein translocase protein TatB [Usitatibacter sp.]|jgi:sec-independent protein translocase protein TatB|nr:Sec-independent protein translocase protein TatB [Usitatibacter sp.]
MFDFGFSKLFILAVIALVVIGPERLPRVARTLGHLYGRLQRYVTQVKSDIHREMENADLGKMKTEFESAARSFQSTVETGMQDVDREVRDAQASVERALDVHPPAANEAAANEAPAAPAPETPPSPQLELGIEEPRATPPTLDRASG